MHDYGRPGHCFFVFHTRKVIKSLLLDAVHLMDGISSGGGGIVPGDADQVSQQIEGISSVAAGLCLDPTLPRSDKKLPKFTE